MCLAGAVVACWVAGLSPFNVINFFVTEFTEFSEKHLGKTPLVFIVGPLIPLFWTSGDVCLKFPS